MVRFAVTAPPPTGLRSGPFSAQLALAQIHSRLVPMTKLANGYAVDPACTEGWFELHAGRGLAGYGLARALRLLLDVLGGLSALHDTHTDGGQPFVHGELVPALVRVDSSGVARLIPLAPWHWLAPGTLAVAERVGHLAPERLLGDAVDQRADVFSAGVWLWEALAGRRLFDSDSVDTIITRLMGGRIALPTLPPELAWAIPLKAVAMCALSVDPAQRFASVGDLSDAIEAVAADHLATNADVVAFLAARDPHARPSVIARPVYVPTHLSSLSALVSPVSRSDAAQAASTSAARAPLAPRSRGNGRLWAGAAALSLFVAVGAGLAARTAARGPAAVAVSPAAAARPRVERLAPALSARDLPSPPPSSAPSEGAPPPMLPAPPSSETGVGPMKALKAPKGLKTSVPKLKTAPKWRPGRDRAAEKYGI
ncbi:MAG: hypothetical protein ABW061_00295 [Polyangiaceae bacterium]